ncbi:DEAD/DEAH box helicase [Sphingobacterium mizutaii]|uniref:DEAD/DEAH box helicase n=1 Tax=Sphingobacterium mizutaii TaxID=1010 RepID=UPI0028A66897|nr:DEAD/DEAH box helicase [Sphingobacterium mizutaii]
MGEELRNYQKNIIKDTLYNLNHHRSIMLQMPTGTGKTTVMSSLVKTYIKKIEPNKRILIVVHRKELVEQIYLRLRRFGILAGIIMSGENYEPTKQVQVASISTLIRKKELPFNISLVVVDEAHHILAKTYLDVIKKYKDSKVLGLTATPIRLNGDGFDHIFEKLICSHKIEWFIENKYLSQYKHLALIDQSIKNIQIDKIKNEYDQSSLTEFMQSDRKIANVLAAYQRYSIGRKTIIFCVDINHMKKLAERFLANNIQNHCIDSFTKKEEREAILKSFRNGDVNVLFNVNIFTEGFDCPDIETVILARPTKSLVLYIQQIGRVLRYKPGNYGLILDCGNLISDHGSILKNQSWSLKSSRVISESRQDEDAGSNKERKSEIKELEFDELEVFDEFIIKNDLYKPSYQEMKLLLKSLAEIPFEQYNSLEDLNYMLNATVLKMLRLKFKRRKVLNKGDKMVIKARANEYLKMMEENKVYKNNIVKKVKFNTPKDKGNLKEIDIENIKEDLKSVFDNLLFD